MTRRARPPRLDQETSIQQSTREDPPIARILYLRDESSTEAPVLRTLLNSTDHPRISLCEVSSRDAFLRSLRTESWDVVLCDNDSTALGGEEALNTILRECPDSPVILLASEPHEGKMLQLLEAGAKDYILKDHTQRLLLSIHRILRESASEQERRRSEAKYRALFTSIDEGYCIIEVLFDDAGKAIDYRFLEANPAFEKQTGLLNAIGRRVRDLVPEHEEHWFEIYGRVALTGEPVRFQNIAAQLHRYYDVYAFRFGLPKDHQVAVLFTDIREHKEAEEQLARSSQKLQEILSSIQDDFRVLDRDWRIVYANDLFASRIGKDVKDLHGKDFWELFPRYLKTPYEDNLREAMEKREIRRFEMAGKYSDAWYRVAVFPTSEGISVLSTDITERKRSEEALAAAHRQIQDVIDNTPAIVYALDLEERFVMVNAALASMLNTTPEQMIGKRRHEFMPKGDADWHEANDRKVIEAGRALEFEEYSQLNGRSITWLTTKFPLRDAQGKTYGVAGISADISERKRGEEELRQSEERYRLLFENLNSAFVLTEPILDGDGRLVDLKFLMANPAVNKHLKKSPNELIGKRISEIFRYDGRNPVFDIYERVLSTGEPYKGELLLPAIGRHYDVAVYCPIPGQLAVAMSDISERKRAEDDARKKQEEIESLLKVSPAAIFVADDPACTRITGNPAAYRLVNMSEAPEANLSVSAVEGERPTYRIFRDGVEVPAEKLPMQRAAATGQDVYDDSMEARFEDGSHKHILSYASPLFNSDGSVRGVVGSMLDISQLKHAEAILKESEERFRIMADSTPVPIWMTNARGEVEMVNHAYEEFYGVTEDQLRPPSTWKATLHPDDEESHVSAFLHALQRQGAFDAEVRVKHRSGQWRWVHSYVVPRFSKDGTFLGYVGSSPDVTHEKQAMDALKASELNLRLMVSQAGEAMMVVSPGGTIESVSRLAMELLGYSEGELVGRNVGEFAETLSRLEALLTVEDLRRKAPQPVTTTVRAKRKTGEPQWLSVTASFVNVGTNVEKYFVRFQSLQLPDGQLRSWQ